MKAGDKVYKPRVAYPSFPQRKDTWGDYLEGNRSRWRGRGIRWWWEGVISELVEGSVSGKGRVGEVGEGEYKILTAYSSVIQSPRFLSKQCFNVAT